MMSTLESEIGVSFLLLIWCFFFLTAANIARFAALSLEPASIVAPLVWTYPIILLFFSFVLNRKIEIFNRVVIFGTITVVAGSLLLI